MSGSICCRIYIWVFWYSIVSRPLIFQRYLTCLIPSWLLCILVWFCFYISWVSILTFIAFILHSKSYCNSKQNLAYWEALTKTIQHSSLFLHRDLHDDDNAQGCKRRREEAGWLSVDVLSCWFTCCVAPGLTHIHTTCKLIFSLPQSTA